MDKITDQNSEDNRRFTRVVFSRTAKLLLGPKTYQKSQIHNLSLGGLFLEGQYEANIGEICELELYETGRHSCLILKIQARVVRLEPNGIAVEFLNMPMDSYSYLQTMVLYSTDDPYGVSLEFLEDFFKVSQQTTH